MIWFSDVADFPFMRNRFFISASGRVRDRCVWGAIFCLLVFVYRRGFFESFAVVDSVTSSEIFFALVIPVLRPLLSCGISFIPPFAYNFPIVERYSPTRGLVQSDLCIIG